MQPAVADTNPADSPYPQWSATGAYPSGYKVTENGEFYRARWFNTGDDPQPQVQYSWQTPWELLGPVLPGSSHAPATPKPSSGSYPAWSVTPGYKTGEDVRYYGLPYEVKWGNQGVSPASVTTDPGNSPWKALYKISGEPAGPTVSATPVVSATATA